IFKYELEDLGMAPDNMQEMSKESLLRSLQDILLESAKQGIRTIVIIDEAQEIPENTLEELRLLSNLETDKAKLLQIMLVGQLELEEKLNQDNFKQLHQRITIRYRLETLTLDETVNYIHHRLKVAGGGNINRFSLAIIKQIHRLTNGVPRIINTLCERSLMAAFVDGKSSVNREHLHNAMQSLECNTSGTAGSNSKKQLVFFLFMALILAGIAMYFSHAPFQKLIHLKTGQLAAIWHTKIMDRTAPAKQDTVERTVKDIDTAGGDTHLNSGQQKEETEVIQPAAKPIPVDSHNEIVHGQNAQQDEKKKQEPEDLAVSQPAVMSVGPANKPDKETPGNSASATGETPEEMTSNRNEASIANQQPIPERIKNLVALPPGWRSITIQPKKKKVLLFQSDSSVPVRELSLPAGITPEDGIYLLGQDKGKPFLFSHRSFFAWQVNQSLADWLWFQFMDDQSPPVIPVIVSSSDPEQLPKQQELSTLQAMVKNWAAAFDQKNIQKLMSYYDDSLVTYRLFRNSPTVKSHAEVLARKKEIFEKNKAVSLQISDPACIVNSEDPSRAMAFFYQRFISSSYRDTGIKVLYFRKTGANTSNRPEWVITGRLWLPVQEEKEKAGLI
ncbi:MAG: AAA family ATPase, partial [Thermodesulfobacteriota bacterium]|nr:AAA family ATPase [Thermodesulfobacteriota bacterium]